MSSTAAMPIPDDSATNTPLLGRYQLLERIGAGGMAELFRARMLGAAGFEKELVIKKVLPHLSADASFVRMLKNEARIAAGLNHVNVVSVLDFAQVDDQYFLVMEYVDGSSLQQLLSVACQQGKRIRRLLAAWIVREVCKGLDYIHRKCDRDGRPLGIVHRDISPENVLISREGEVKIIDFGIARAVDQASHTRHGVVKGKVAYLSPEQLAGQKADHRADIYAAGVMLYELLAGRLPFEGRTDLVTIARIRRGDCQPVTEVDPLVPAALGRIVERAMAVEPAARYQAAAGMASALEEHLRSADDRVNTRVIADFTRRQKEYLDDPRHDTAWVRCIEPGDEAGEDRFVHVLASPCDAAGDADRHVHDAPTDVGPGPRRPRVRVRGRWRLRMLAAAIGLLLGLLIVLAFYRPRPPEQVWTRSRPAAAVPPAPADQPVVPPPS